MLGCVAAVAHLWARLLQECLHMKHNEEVVYLRRRTGEGRTTVSRTDPAS